MKTEELKKVLAKYYNAECTEDEEQLLREFFSGEDVPEELSEEKDIFNFYSGERIFREPSEDFEERIISSIDRKESVIARKSVRRIVTALSGIAAGLLILAGSYFFLTGREEPGDTFSDPELAYAETMKILFDVSERMNSSVRALEPMEKIGDAAEKSLNLFSEQASKIDQNLEAIDKFKKTMENMNMILE